MAEGGKELDTIIVKEQFKLSGGQTTSTLDGKKPKRPEYTCPEKMMETYKFYRGALPKSLLVEAGQIYTEVYCTTRCHFCDGAHKDWKAGDDPFEVHAKCYPDCQYIKMILVDRQQENTLDTSVNVEYQGGAVDNVEAASTLQSLNENGRDTVGAISILQRSGDYSRNPQGLIMEASSMSEPSDSNQTPQELYEEVYQRKRFVFAEDKIKDDFKTIAAQSCLQFASEQEVKEAIRIFRQRENIVQITAKDLLEIVLDKKEEMEKNLEMKSMEGAVNNIVKLTYISIEAIPNHSLSAITQTVQNVPIVSTTSFKINKAKEKEFRFLRHN